ncbi:MAG: ABC transporter substrate-binding protein [Acidimicrobiales bacterium]
MLALPDPVIIDVEAPNGEEVGLMARLRTVRSLKVMAVVSSLSVLTAACSSSGAGKASSTSPTGASGGANAATLSIGTSADFPPMMIRDPQDPTKLSGFEYDMVAAIMGHLNQKYTFKIQSFSGLVPAVQAHQLDVVVSDVYDTPAREKVVDFVDYLQTTLSVLVAEKSVSGVHAFNDLCGKSLGIVTGAATEATAAGAASQQCVSAGKSAINVVSLPSVPDELVQIDNGRLDAILEDALSLAYVVKTEPGKYAVAFNDPATATKIGMVVAKGSALKAKLAAGVQWYLQSPQYQTDATKWGIPSASLLH